MFFCDSLIIRFVFAAASFDGFLCSSVLYLRQQTSCALLTIPHIIWFQRGYLASMISRTNSPAATYSRVCVCASLSLSLSLYLYLSLSIYLSIYLSLRERGGVGARVAKWYSAHDLRWGCVIECNFFEIEAQREKERERDFHTLISLLSFLLIY